MQKYRLAVDSDVRRMATGSDDALADIERGGEPPAGRRARPHQVRHCPARRNFAHGFMQALYARADARDRQTGEPTPEAPRLIWDFLGTIDKLPFPLVARGEYEHVGIKPLGGFNSVPVREFRGALVRPFESKGIDVGLNIFIASGYGGQTIETLALPSEGEPFDRITDLPLRSYVTASFTYYFRRSRI